MPKRKAFENTSSQSEGINIKTEPSSSEDNRNSIPEHEGGEFANSIDDESVGAQDDFFNNFKIESPSEPTKPKTKKKKGSWVPKRQYQCLSCFHRSNRRSNMTDHLKIHKPATDLEWFPCGLCDYKAKHKRSVSRHQRKVHKINHTIACGESGIQENETTSEGTDGTKVKQELTETPPEFVVYQEHCTLEQLDAEPDDRRLTGKFDCTKIGYIETFIQRRNMNYQGAIYQCQTCPYESKKKGNMRDHVVTHKPLSEIDWYTCSKCNYQTKHKRSMTRHIETVHKLIQNECKILVKRISGANSVCIGETDFSLAIDEGFIEIKDELSLKLLSKTSGGTRGNPDQPKLNPPKRSKLAEEVVGVKKEPTEEVENGNKVVKMEEDKDSSEKDIDSGRDKPQDVDSSELDNILTSSEDALGDTENFPNVNGFSCNKCDYGTNDLEELDAHYTTHHDAVEHMNLEESPFDVPSSTENALAEC